MYRKLFFIFVIFTLVTGFATGFAAARQPWWYTLERGIEHFRNGSYGNALIAFEDARRDRAAQYTRMEQDLILLLSHPNVRPLENSLEYIEMYIDINYETAAAAVLEELYHKVPRETLKDSALLALKELDRLKVFPEAEFWLGETYRVEGEINLALHHYERAYNQRIMLENSGFDVEILYKIVDIHRILQNYQEMDSRAREIIEGQLASGAPRDVFWARTATQTESPMAPMRVAMLDILRREGVDRFLTLYRHNNLVTERAHRFLGTFYNVTGRHTVAVEHLTFAFLIQNTVLIDEVIRSEFDYNFINLENLMNSISRRPDLLAFIDDVEYYETIFYLAGSLQVTGRTIPAMQLWTFLAGNANSGEWGERARRNPAPYVERAIELP